MVFNLQQREGGGLPARRGASMEREGFKLKREGHQQKLKDFEKMGSFYSGVRVLNWRGGLCAEEEPLTKGTGFCREGGSSTKVGGVSIERVDQSDIQSGSEVITCKVLNILDWFLLQGNVGGHCCLDKGYLWTQMKEIPCGTDAGFSARPLQAAPTVTCCYLFSSSSRRKLWSWCILVDNLRGREQVRSRHSCPHWQEQPWIIEIWKQEAPLRLKSKPAWPNGGSANGIGHLLPPGPKRLTFLR